MGLVSLLIVAASTSMSVVPTGAAHTESVSHRGSSYNVEYEAQVTGQTRTIGAATGARPSTQRCVVTVRIAIERSIAAAGSPQALSTLLPATRTLERHLPGDCLGRSREPAKLASSQGDAIHSHLAQVASADRAQALAAIDSAHNFAVN